MHVHLADRFEARASGLHALDPRVKILLTAIFILGLSLTPTGAWLAYVVLLATVLAATVAARLGFGYGLRRSYIALPFVLAAAALPFTVAGDAVIRLPGVGWTVSDAGLVRFATIVLRTWIAVQAALLLTATTAFPDLLWGLGALRVPRVIVSILGLMYRYLFLAGDEAVRLMRARQARAAAPGGRRPPLAWRSRVAGSMIGTLFLRAVDRGERVYAAMLARGYDGEARSLVRFHMHTSDWLALGVGVLWTAAVVAVVGMA